MQWTLVLSAAAALVLVVQAEDECMPKPGEKRTHPWECCKIEGLIPTKFQDNIKKCVEKFPITKPPSPPAPGSKLPAEVRNAVVCAAECVFAENGMLTPDKKLDKAAITKGIAETAAGHKEMEPLVNTVVDKCFAAAAADADQSLDCKSGAKEFEQCIMREGFLACPQALWTDNADCGALKAKVAKCPKIPIMLHPPGHH